MAKVEKKGKDSPAFCHNCQFCGFFPYEMSEKSREKGKKFSVGEQGMGPI